MECGASRDAAVVLELIDEATAERGEQLVTRIAKMPAMMCHFR